jgi:hypothetical protein
MWKYCHVLPGNATNKLWVLDFAIRFTGYLPVETTTDNNSFKFTHKSGVLTTCQFFTDWSLVFFCAPSPRCLVTCFCRDFYSLVTELKLSLHSLLIRKWLPHLELPSFGNSLPNITIVALYSLRADRTKCTVPLLVSTDHTENISCGSQWMSLLARWPSPSNEL